MKQKLFVRMLAAMLLIISFGNGHASRTCTAKKPEPVAKAHSATSTIHFTPLDIFKW